MEPEYEEEDQSLPQAVPERKVKRTLTDKQLKNLELMRQKKMAKKEASKMIADSVRNSAREADAEEFSNLKNELAEIKKKLAAPPPEIPKSKPKKAAPVTAVSGRPTNTVRCQRKRIVELSDSDEYQDAVEYSNPYLMQLVRR
jgi:hypothetical protein